MARAWLAENVHRPRIVTPARQREKMDARRHLPDDPADGRVILTGGGQQNGMLLREITSRLRFLVDVIDGCYSLNSKAMTKANKKGAKGRKARAA